MEKKVPEYQRIYTEIREQIVKGAYRFGEKLPSRRALAEREGVSVITISHAYDLLCEEGYAAPRERSGYFVIFNDSDPFLSADYETKKSSASRTAETTRTVSDALSKGSEERHLLHNSTTNSVSAAQSQRVQGLTPSSGEKNRDSIWQSLTPVDPIPFQTYARTVRRVLSTEGEKLFLKSENTGNCALRTAIAAYLARNRGMNVSPGQIVIGSGAEYLYGVVVYMLGRGIIYGIEDPSYETIEMVYNRNGARTEKLEMGTDGIRSKALRETTASVLHVTPYHSFPSFVTASANKRYEYIAWARRRNGFIIEDDYDSEFSLSGKLNGTLFSMEPSRHVIYINTFSRTISRGTRIGYMILPSERCSELLSKIDFFSCTVPVLDQAVLTELLNSGTFERHINKMRRRIRGNQ